MQQRKEIVLIGGGHSHALLLRRWGGMPPPGSRLSLINPGAIATYSGMLPGYLSGQYQRTALEINLVDLTRFSNAQFIEGEAIALDLQRQEVMVPGLPPLRYDLVSVDIGISTRLPTLPGFVPHALPVKPLPGFIEGWTAFLRRLTSEACPADLVMIGGGVAGIELALNIDLRLRALGLTPKIAVIAHRNALPNLNKPARTKLLAELHARQILLREHAQIAEITAKAVRLTDGSTLPSALTIAAAAPCPAPWLAATGLGLQDGFIAVDAYLRSLTHPALFAVGDCSHLTASPRPKAGVFAVRAAKILDYNLRARLENRPLRPFRPQSRYLKLISLGPKRALAEKGPIMLSGPLVWRWKDWIDRRFMAQFHNLPPAPK